MFGIGLLEMAVVAIIGIVFIGPKKLPEVMRYVGKFFVQAKRMTNEVKSTLDNVVYEAERELHLENLKKINDMTKGTLNTKVNEALKDEEQNKTKDHQEDDHKKDQQDQHLGHTTMDIHDDHHHNHIDFDNNPYKDDVSKEQPGNHEESKKLEKPEKEEQQK